MSEIDAETALRRNPYGPPDAWNGWNPVPSRTAYTTGRIVPGCTCNRTDRQCRKRQSASLPKRRIQRLSGKTCQRSSPGGCCFESSSKRTGQTEWGSHPIGNRKGYPDLWADSKTLSHDHNRQRMRPSWISEKRIRYFCLSLLRLYRPGTLSGWTRAEIRWTVVTYGVRKKRLFTAPGCVRLWKIFRRKAERVPKHNPYYHG